MMIQYVKIIFIMDLLGLTQQLSNYIIRPPRASYSLTDLGETVFEYKGIIYERIDFTIPPSNNNKKLQCSIYLDRFNKNTIIRPTVLYLHANSSSRLTVKNYLKNLLPKFDVIAFDFRGCGLSQGNYLTLGYLEKQDVRIVLEYVDNKFGKRKYLIWGRSMGAVTAILYTAKYQANSQRISALVLDSPFADLQKIIHFLADQKAPLIPSFMVQSIIDNIQEYTKQKIQKQYNKQFLIRKHKPINQISKIRIPIFFVGSKKDQLVDCTHLQQYYDKAFCYKQMELLEGGHNQVRPDHLKLAILQFLVASLNMKREPTVRRKIFRFGQKQSTPFAVEKSQSLPLNQTFDDKNKSFNTSNPQTSRIFERSRSKSSHKIPQITKDQLTKKSPRGARVWKNSNSINQLSNTSNIQIKQKQQQKASQKQKQINNLNMLGNGKQQLTSDMAILKSHAQILDKVLPKNNSKRTHRIFTNSNSLIQDTTNPNIDKFF